MRCRALMCSLWINLAWLSPAVFAQVVNLSGQWPQFHGPQRNAVSPDTGLLTEWPENGPPLVWEAHGAGRGYASVAIVGQRLYTMGDGLSVAEDKDVDVAKG